MSTSSDRIKGAGRAIQPVDEQMKFSSESKTHGPLLGRLYLVTSFLSLLAIVFWHSERFQVFGSDFMLGWDNPNYIRLANDLSRNGLLQSVTTWSYPQLYVQVLAALGYVIGNVTLVDRVLPVAFAFLSIYAAFFVALDVSTNVHIAGLSSILQATSISFLKLVSGNDRNLMAFSLSFVAMLVVQRMWTKETRARDYFSLTVLSATIAATSFETFLILSPTLIISGLLTKKGRNILAAIFAVAVPVVLLLIAFPSFFLTYFQAVETPIQTPKQVLGPADLFYWMGGSVVMVVISFIGMAYVFARWWRRRDVLSLLIFVWSTILIVIFLAADIRLAGLQAEFGIRALLLVPSYVLVPLGVFVVWAALSRVLRQRKLPIGIVGSKGIASALTVIFVIAIIVTSSGFAISESGTYFNTYISTTAYNKMVLTSNYVAERSHGVPVVVFYGSAEYDSLYRSYIGALMGEHFAYYGDLSNLLQLRPTAPNSSDPYISGLESYLSRSYLDELTGKSSGPTQFGHRSYITDRAALMSHTIILIAPEIYDGALPGFLANFHIGDGIYVVPPGGLADPRQQETVSNVMISRDGIAGRLPGLYTYLDPFDPNHRYLLVNASSGFENYNITSYPSDWWFLGIEQGGNPSGLDFHPKRLNGDSATVGNDYADSLRGWTPIPDNASIASDNISKMEGNASVRVHGTRDPYGNLGLTLPLPIVDLSHYDTVNFWAKCLDCSSMTMNLVDNGGNVLTFYGLRGAGGQPTSTYQRFSINIGMPTGESVGFNPQSIASISFLAYSSNKTSMTLWIDDLVVQDEISNPPFLYKGRVLLTDQVEFVFEQRIQGSEKSPNFLPLLSYPPLMDESALIATLSIFVSITLLIHIRSGRPRPRKTISYT